MQFILKLFHVFILFNPVTIKFQHVFLSNPWHQKTSHKKEYLTNKKMKFPLRTSQFNFSRYSICFPGNSKSGFPSPPPQVQYRTEISQLSPIQILTPPSNLDYLFEMVWQCHITGIFYVHFSNQLTVLWLLQPNYF